jgi:cell division protease FtsH
VFKNPKKNKIILFTGLGLILLAVICVGVYLRLPFDDALSPRAQVSEVVSSPEGLTDREESPTRLAVGVIPSKEYEVLLETEFAKIADAQINYETGVTGSVVGNEGIKAARFLPDQLLALVEKYEKNNIEVTIVSAQTKIIDTDDGATQTVNTAPVGGRGQPIPIGWAIVLTFLIVAIVLIFFKSSFGKAPTSRRDEEINSIPETRFSDVAGASEAVEDLKEIVMFLKNPEKFEKAGAKISKGALLVGPPGTGKTLLARAVAGEANVPFYSVAGSDFVEMYVGVGAKRVRELFNKAKKHPQGCIIFIDEIDAVGRKRGGDSSNNNYEHENTLNSLLVEMDGFTQTNIIVIGATNREDTLDPALTRPGRLDRTVHVGLPDRLGREKILKVHTAELNLASDVDLDLIARRTPGMSGADLAQVVNEACLEAARNERSEVSGDDFSSGLATLAMGKARVSAVVSDSDRKITAWHEAGHTVAAMVLQDADDPVSVSIIPRGPAGGVTWMAEGDDLFLTRNKAFAKLVVAMSGRAGEELLLNGEFTTGPHGDLQYATNLGLAMVTQYGMSDLGLMIKSNELLASGSDSTSATVNAVEELLGNALKIARRTLMENYELLVNIKNALLENDTLNLEDLKNLKEKTQKVTTITADSVHIIKTQSGKDYKLVRDTLKNSNRKVNANKNDKILVKNLVKIKTLILKNRKKKAY